MNDVIKSSMPKIVSSFSKFFEIDFTIKLFGVKVFTFHWPPVADVDNVDELQTNKS